LEKREFRWEQMPVLYVNYFFFLSFSCHQLQLLCINMIMYNNNSSMYVCVSKYSVFWQKIWNWSNLFVNSYNIRIILNLSGLWFLFTFELVEKVFTRHGFLEYRKSVLMAFFETGMPYLWSSCPQKIININKQQLNFR